MSPLLALVVGCPNPEVESRTYFEQRVAPVLDENCVRGPADNLCHAESEQKPGEAQGNLDLSSFEAVKSRPELLSAYGSYPEPPLLLKAVKPEELVIRYAGQTHQSEIFHAGGGILSHNSDAFLELQQWLKNGATEDGTLPELEDPQRTGPCSEKLSPDVEPHLDLATGPVFEAYKRDIEPIFADPEDGCATESCHGSSQSDFYLTCGNTEEQLRHNFVVAQSFVAAEGDRSELLLRPLSANAGGVDHSGGTIWTSVEDEDFATLREWAREAGPLQLGEESPQYRYFADHVMPVLLKRGCALPQCHSPLGFNDFRLRAGSRGFFSPLALRRNYEATLEFVSLTAKDPNESRLLKKNISVDKGRIEHRAGPTILAIDGSDRGGDPTVCPPGEDEQPSSYCTVVEWIRRERAEAVEAGLVSALDDAESATVIYVDRPANADRLIDFATYRGDARLMRIDLTFGPGGRVIDDDGNPYGVGAPTEIDLSGCTGATDYDVRGPEVSYDGSRMVFALRAGQDDGLDIYESALDGSDCVQLTADGGEVDSQVPIHNFDPVYVPDDAVNNPGGAIVFASTRPGREGRSHVSPRYRLPASNLWRMARDGSGLEQMTFLTGSELSPAMMQKGQLIMTTEKAAEGLYQLSGRRINWDLTDYHPLLAQRATIGYQQATEIREHLDGNFLLILSDASARFGGGALATFNRSIGPFEIDREGEPGYVEALEFPDPAAREAGTGPARGAYRSPFPLPDGSLLVSWASGELDLTDPDAPVDYDLVVLDRVTGQRARLAGEDDGRFQIEAVMAYRRGKRKVFVNIPELVFGGTSVEEAAPLHRAWAHFPDFPMLATLLTNNRRGDRGLERLAEGDTIAVYQAEPPPVGDTNDGSTFQDWTLVGTHALEADGSVFLDVPASVPVVLELRKGSKALLTMTEEHQFGAGEMTSLGIHRTFFDGVCGGCHGSVEGPELDVVVDPDALTGASVSLARPESTTRPDPL